MNAPDALRHLQGHPHEWLPVTGQNTVDALRQLRREGHRILTRFTDDGVRQAKYVPPAAPLPDAAAVITDLVEEARRVFDGEITRIVDADGVILMEDRGELADMPVVPAPLTPGMAGRPFPMAVAQDDSQNFRVELAPRIRCYCGDEYLIYEDHVRSQRHQNWLGGETQLEVPHPEQPPNYKFPFGQVPEHFELGTVVLCPVCKNKRTGERKLKNGSIAPANPFSHATGKPGRPCSNCNGNGMVPNIGPIQTATQGGQRDEPDRPSEPAPGQLTTEAAGDASGG